MAPERHLWSYREVGETSVINSVGYAGLTAAPMGAAIQCQSKPTIKIIGNAGAGAARIRFQSAAHREQRSWKLAVHVRAGIKEGVSAVKLPLGSRPLLSCGEGGNRTHGSNHYRQHC